jgi:misacylated tRNA(Ala) deacylase
MAVYLCHESPDLYEHEATVLEVRPGAVLLDRSAFHPGGGGQVADRGTIETAAGVQSVTGVEVAPEGWWHLLEEATGVPSSSR